MFAHLHIRSWFSFLQGGSSPARLAERAAAAGGIGALGLTDVGGVYGAVQHQQACEAHGLKPLFGAEVTVEGRPLVLLATTNRGYAHLCQLLTAAHLHDRQNPDLELPTLARFAEGLHCLTGTRSSALWHLVDDAREREAAVWLRTLKQVFGENLSVELAHHLRPGDRARLRRLVALAAAEHIPTVATGDVRHAEPDDYATYDLLQCVRHGLTVFDTHLERPRNAEQHLKHPDDLAFLIPYPGAFARAAEIAERAHVDLLPGRITPPAARLPEGELAAAVLRRTCEAALPRLYAQNSAQAREQLGRELAVIERLELDEFFLVVHEIVEEARRREIRCAGRGSAANSIVAYLLGITAVDPLAHNLLFERFLHGGRAGTPDIDVDFDSDRRDEIIAWMEDRFGIEQTAMTATLITYGLRSALRDVAKALGWPLEVIGTLTKSVPPRSARSVRLYADRIHEVLGHAPLVDTLIDMVERLDGCPRHLGLHSGGMVLSRVPLYHFTPIQVSANGVRMVQFAKDDVECLGLVKLDVLGLRMLATLSETTELVRRHMAPGFDLDALPLDDRPTFNLIRAGKTLGVFQIESQGQLHLLARNQPETFDDLIAEISLFRPGPLQGNMVTPYVLRRQGKERVTYDHPDLEPILADTYGIILFQEQVLEVAHRFAGMSLEAADAFRRLMSKFRDPGEMGEMRGVFVGSAVRRGVPKGVADHIFEKVAGFVGYGFCRSHAAAFAKTVYQSAYLKRHFPAAFMAALMQHRPGMYNLMTLEEEARRFGVPILLPDVHRSALRYDMERIDDGRWAIRKPLTSIQRIAPDDARKIFYERLQDGPFASVEDFFQRVALPIDKIEALARSGAMDELSRSARHALWEVGVAARRLGRAGRRKEPTLFDARVVEALDVPALPLLSLAERLSWDYETHGAARQHPMTLYRRTLTELEIRPIETCYRFGKTVAHDPLQPPHLTVAGITILRQKPPTANGCLFVAIEDETGFIQTIVYPRLADRLHRVFRKAALVVCGHLQIEGNWRGLVVTDAWPLDGLFGGYEGSASSSGGRDRWHRRPERPMNAGHLADERDQGAPVDQTRG